LKGFRLHRHPLSRTSPVAISLNFGFGRIPDFLASDSCTRGQGARSNGCAMTLDWTKFTARWPFLCRFLDAGNTRGASHSGGQRPKSAKARSRGKLGSGWAASAMGISG
jgi:hypothetical protein